MLGGHTPVADRQAVTTQRPRGAGAGESLRGGPYPRLIAIAVTVGLLAALVVYLASIQGEIREEWGEDYFFFRQAAHRWLETGSFYNPHQLAGPYEARVAVDVLYPPVALYLFVPFLWLPGFLWWTIPLGILAWHVITARPAWWSWPILALLLYVPRTESMVIWANTGMWVAALVALALRWPFFGSWILFKPTFVPFALIDVRRWAWWLGLAVLAVASVVMLPLWFDYLAAMRNNVGPWPGGVEYSLPDYLMLLIPIVAWVARTRPSRAGWLEARR